MRTADQDATPREAGAFQPPPDVAELRRHLMQHADARVYVDFDYTLFGSNSTEVFLNSGRPATLAAVLLRLLRGLRPWALLDRPRGEFLWRDAVRIWAILVLLPWALPLFNRRAPALFARYANKPLADWLATVEPSRVVIISNGYTRIIRALLRDHPLQNATLIASSLREPTQLRRSGKLARLAELDLAPAHERDIVLTDSLDDADLLGAVERGYLAKPLGLDNHNQLAGVYVPFFYSARVKRSPEFVIKQMLLEEVPIMLLATVLLQPFEPALWLGALALALAFLTVYEIGYAENDRIGYLKEATPKLAADYEEFKDIRLEPYAWYWAAGLTALGAMLLGDAFCAQALQRLGLGAAGDVVGNRTAVGALWLVAVVAGRLVFHLYNRMAMVWRLFGYVLLHFSKYFSLVLLFPSQPAGYALLCAQIVRTWSLYAIRRAGGEMELVASQSIRLVFYIFLLLAFDLSTPGPTLFAQWPTWLLLAFCVVRAVPEARRKLFDADVLGLGMRGSDDRR